jgi:ankyrin repeat protein
LAAGANVHACDHKGWSALTWAVKTKRLPIAELLLQRMLHEFSIFY